MKVGMLFLISDTNKKISNFLISQWTKEITFSRQMRISIALNGSKTMHSDRLFFMLQVSLLVISINRS